MQANKDYESRLKQEKLEQQKSYNSILATQLKFKEEFTAKYGTMTENERKLNGKDLSVPIGLHSLGV